MNINRIGQIVMFFALALATVAVIMLLTRSIHRPYSAKDLQEYIAEVAVVSGDSLSTLLSAQGISMQEINTIAQILKKDVGIAGLRADSDKLVFSGGKKDIGVNKIVLIPSPWKQVEITCDEARNWTTKTIDIEPERRMIQRGGQIQDGDSFYLAGMRAGISAGILSDVYDLLAFEMDFERDIRSGQKFSVLYEENFASGQKVENGRVIAVEFEALRGVVKMYRFRKSDKKIGYYDENGNGAIKSLKRTPINNARVTSSFKNKRKHPVLGFTRAHKGVDFRAPTGTPIPSAGAGRVTVRKYDRGYGNYVRIRHNGSYETLYGHMSRFAKGVGVGTTVRQGQIIGYAGSTGLSTGPHLHYEIIKDGKHVNPLTVKLPAIDNLSTSEKTNFIKYRKILDDAWGTLNDNSDWFIQMY